MALTVQELQAKRESLVKQLAKVDTAIAQAGFVSALVPGAYVYGKLNDGTVFEHARMLGKTEAQGTSGEWYKLRLNEDTPEEIVKSVRLSNIDGVEGAAPAAEQTDAAPASAKGKKDMSASEI